MKAGDILTLGLLIFGLAALRARQMPNMNDKRSAGQLATLVPGFREAVARVVAAMRTAGYDAVVREGLRSAARARELAAKGTGIVSSLHKLGLAVDIISASKGWNASPEFWQALRSAAEKEGLTSGASFSKADRAHVQAVPVSEQSTARRWSAIERERKMRARFG